MFEGEEPLLTLKILTTMQCIYKFVNVTFFFFTLLHIYKHGSLKNLNGSSMALHEEPSGFFFFKSVVLDKSIC